MSQKVIWSRSMASLIPWISASWTELPEAKPLDDEKKMRSLAMQSRESRSTISRGTRSGGPPATGRASIHRTTRDSRKSASTRIGSPSGPTNPSPENAVPSEWASPAGTKCSA